MTASFCLCFLSQIEYIPDTKSPSQASVRGFVLLREPFTGLEPAPSKQAEATLCSVSATNILQNLRFYKFQININAKPKQGKQSIHP